MIAAHGGCTDILSSLLEHGAEVNQQDVSNLSCYTGHELLVACLRKCCYNLLPI